MTRNTPANVLKGQDREQTSGVLAPLLIAALMSIVILASAMVSDFPLVSPDSGGYLPTGESFMCAACGNPEEPPVTATGWGRVSLAGDSFRDLPTSAFYAAFGELPGFTANTWRVLIQVMMVIGGFWVLAVGTVRMMAAVPALTIVTATGLYLASPTGMTHSLTIGAEGLATALLLFGIGFSLMALASNKPSRIYWFAGAAFLFLFGLTVTRVSLAPLLLIPIGIVLRTSLQIRGRERIIVLGSVGILLASSTVWLGSVIDNRSAAWGDVPERTYRMMVLVSPDDNPLSEKVKKALPPSAPECLRDLPPGLDWGGKGKYAIEVCGPLATTWIDENYTALMLQTWLLNPTTWMHYSLTLAGDAAKPSINPQIASAVPPPVDSMLFAASTYNPLFWTAATLTLAILLVLLSVVGKLRGMIRNPGSGYRNRAHLTAVGTIAAILMLFLLSFVASYSDQAAAANRKSWPAFPGIMVATSVLAVAMVRRNRTTLR